MASQEVTSFSGRNRFFANHITSVSGLSSRHSVNTTRLFPSLSNHRSTNFLSLLDGCLSTLQFSILVFPEADRNVLQGTMEVTGVETLEFKKFWSLVIVQGYLGRLLYHVLTIRKDVVLILVIASKLITYTNDCSVPGAHRVVCESRKNVIICAITAKSYDYF